MTTDDLTRFEKIREVAGIVTTVALSVAAVCAAAFSAAIAADAIHLLFGWAC